MAITPQAIKDQEFQIKFRGYDTVEVKAYLELIAEEFFELLEQVRQQIDELDVIVEERDSLQADKRTLQEELNTMRGSSEEIQTEFAERDTEVGELQRQIEALKQEITKLENEQTAKEKEIEAAKQQISETENSVTEEKARNDKLRTKLDNLEKQNEELRSEEIDFKSTLVAAQKFTSDLKKKSEQESREIISNAKTEAERLRQATMAELASYPAEIERLKERRNKVKQDLEEVLKLCLENLDVFNEDKEEEDYGELYQKIKFDDNGLLNTDDLDSISMDFDLPVSTKKENEEGDDVFSMKDEMDNIGEESAK